MRRAALTLAAAVAIAVSSSALAGPAEDLAALADEYWAFVLKENPVHASRIGHRKYDAELGDISLAAEDRRAAQAERFLARLNAIPDGGLSPTDRVNKSILKRSLESAVEGNRFGQRTMLFTNRSGWHQQLASIADGLTFRNTADYENYLKRLAKYPALNAEAIRISNQAVRGGYTLPCAAMDGYDKTISGVIPADATRSRLYGPFDRERPAAIAVAEWTSLQARARSLIDGPLRAAYAEHFAWYVREYAPNCSKAVGVSAQPDGAAYYNFRIRQMTTTAMTADEIHRLGLSEVARIRAERGEVARKAGFASREAMIADMRANPRWFARTPAELLAAAAAMAKTIDGKMPGLFTMLPRLPYGIKEIPAETAAGQTTAYYQSGSPAQGIAGFYFVNTSKLDQRPLWELPALTVHEAVPGHHMQIALQQELALPEWRREGAFFTAFAEGWGLYSERLGIEMCIYDTPQKDMGRLGYEMWRAARLVVDTGIHSKGWSKDQAVAFMKDNTTLTDANIDAEVNRYISWPAQALAYKLGELKIRELRGRAEKALGDRFDLRRFHDAVLGQGALPLDTLDAQIEAWIAAEKART